MRSVRDIRKRLWLVSGFPDLGWSTEEEFEAGTRMAPRQTRQLGRTRRRTCRLWRLRPVGPPCRAREVERYRGGGAAFRFRQADRPPAMPFWGGQPDPRATRRGDRRSRFLQPR